MNKNYNIGRTALMQTMAEMDYELTGADIDWTYTALSKFTDTELIELYGILYDEYYNGKYINYEECGNYNIGGGIEDITICGNCRNLKECKQWKQVD